MSEDFFDYDTAFSRNIGLVQPQEQQILRGSTIAIAGMGGVGGVHLTTLARMGIGNFHIADFDIFEIRNFNRQVGAMMSTIGKSKAEVMAAMARDINPTVNIRIFPDGVQPENMDAFLDKVDVVADALDFFAVEARAQLYKAAYARNIPVVTAGTIGCSAASLVFVPSGMTWNDYYGMDLAKNMIDKYVLFLIVNAPAGTHFSYVDRSRVNLAEKRGPSLALAVELCAGVVAAEIMKLLLKRGRAFVAPYFHQFDAYKCKYVIGKLRWGNRGPVQRLKFWFFRKTLAKQLPAGAVDL